MLKITLEIEGMSCGMCEAHINDALRMAFPLQKVHSSYRKKQTELWSDRELIAEEVQKVLSKTGYTLVSMHTETVQKKRLFHQDVEKRNNQE